MLVFFLKTSFFFLTEVTFAEHKMNPVNTPGSLGMLTTSGGHPLCLVPEHSHTRKETRPTRGHPSPPPRPASHSLRSGRFLAGCSRCPHWLAVHQARLASGAGGCDGVRLPGLAAGEGRPRVPGCFSPGPSRSRFPHTGVHPADRLLGERSRCVLFPPGALGGPAAGVHLCLSDRGCIACRRQSGCLAW